MLLVRQMNALNSNHQMSLFKVMVEATVLVGLNELNPKILWMRVDPPYLWVWHLWIPASTGCLAHSSEALLDVTGSWLP